MNIGDKLKNGATLLAQKEERDSVVVLASRNKYPGGAGLEFVTWLLDVNQDTYEGHYYTDLIDAVEDFKKRS